MSGRHSFRELTEGFSPEQRRRIEAIREELLDDMPPHKLPRARSHTAEISLNSSTKNQLVFSKLEQRADHVRLRVIERMEGKRLMYQDLTV